MGRLPGTRFAVIVDEAHSSQSGEMTKSMKQVLTSSSLEEAEREDELEMDIEDQLVAEMTSRRPQKNVSTFAFTGTPKEKTLELFGHRDERGRYAPFRLDATGFAQHCLAVRSPMPSSATLTFLPWMRCFH